MNGNCKTVISTSAKLMGSANLSHCVTLENHGTMLLQVGECSVTAVLMCVDYSAMVFLSTLVVVSCSSFKPSLTEFTCLHDSLHVRQ